MPGGWVGSVVSSCEHGLLAIGLCLWRDLLARGHLSHVGFSCVVTSVAAVWVPTCAAFRVENLTRQVRDSASPSGRGHPSNPRLPLLPRPPGLTLSVSSPALAACEQLFARSPGQRCTRALREKTVSREPMPGASRVTPATAACAPGGRPQRPTGTLHSEHTLQLMKEL